MQKHPPDTDLTRPIGWHLRATGVGASEVYDLVRGDFCGLWLRKRGHVPPSPDSVDATYGRYIETGIRDWYGDQHRHLTVSRCPTMTMPGHPRVVATPDGVVHDTDNTLLRVLEIKCPRFGDNWGPSGSTRIPDRCWWQVQQQMAVTGAGEAHVVAAVHREFRTYAIARHDDAIAALISEIEHFWETYVAPNIRPPVDGSPECSGYLMHAFPCTDPDEWIEDAANDIRDAAEAHQKAADAEKLAADEKRRHKAVLLDHIRGHYGVRGDWGRAVWAPRQGNEKTDHHALALDLLAQFGMRGADADARLAELTEKHTRRSAPTRVLRVTLKQDDD